MTDKSSFWLNNLVSSLGISHYLSTGGEGEGVGEFWGDHMGEQRWGQPLPTEYNGGTIVRRVIRISPSLMGESGEFYRDTTKIIQTPTQGDK